MKIIIVGSGLLGVATAYYLSELGHEVIVVDRQQGPAQETSFANACVLHPSQASPWNHPGIAWQILKWMGKENSPFLLRPSALPSLLKWGLTFLNHAKPEKFQANLRVNTALANYNIECVEDLQKHHPFDYAAQRLGSMKVLGNEQDLENAKEQIALFQAMGIECQVLNQAEVFNKEPALVENGSKLVGGIYYPKDQTGDAHQFCLKLVELAKLKQVQFIYDLNVNEFSIANDKITGIKTNKGDYSADAYVLAAGSYSPLLAKSLKLNLPIRPIKGYSITLDMEDWDLKPQMPVIDEEAHVAITPLGNRLRAAGTAELNGYNTEINSQRIQLVLQQVIARYPQAGANIQNADINPWTGLRPTTADGVPIMGETPISNLYLNTGHGHLGWSLAMGSGKLVAEMINGSDPDINAAPYALSRF
jgi:D-amino-acid dehydrogenase